MFPTLRKSVQVALLLASSCLALAPAQTSAGVADLADGPLANATTLSILPNIMFDLDNSGSMNWDYMPDYVNSGRWCKSTSTTLYTCDPGDPPYYATNFNSLYYNPAVRYQWPVNFDGTLKPDQSNRTAYTKDNANAVYSDGYNIQTIDATFANDPAAPCGTNGNPACGKLAPNAVVDLLNNYPERVWCSSRNADVNGANCKSSLDGTAYSYPDGTYDNLKVRYGAPHYYNVSVEWCRLSTAGFGRAGTCQAKKDGTYRYVRYSNWSRVDIKPTTTFPLKAIGRTDCPAARCTYDQEIANFATWFTWYRSRMQMTKSAIGHSFKDVRGTPKTGAALIADPEDVTYLHARVGLTAINRASSNKVNIANFDTAQKTTFYQKLYAATAADGTPLRSSLRTVGQMYAGDTTNFTDPIQYSCQKNFTILATDGYWNDSTSAFSNFGDKDGGTGVERPSLDAAATPDTLADVAYYYYHTDLRTGACEKCVNNVPPSGTDTDVDDVAQHQHMTTFTVSLGVDGTLTYDDAYKTATSGDYYAIRQGDKNWPVPTADSQETIDDLWHAAVNGRGTYFSTQDPSALEAGLKRALSSIERTTGSGAAAATSNLQPTAGDNFIYIATYRTVKWDGELSAYTIDLNSGAISVDPIWQAEPLLKARMAATGDAENRTIYTASGTTRVLFKDGVGGMTAAQLALFDNTKLSQYVDWGPDQKTAATPMRMVNALRGQDRYEDQIRDENFGVHQRLYRDRERVLGDIIHAQPVYVKAPPHGFADAGYAAFKIAQDARAPSVYVAANDGMLHAFDGATGQERWAYIPPILLPEMWRLLDTNYETGHRYFLDGPLTISDGKVGALWRTVLIGAMGKGGRGYYALDVTDPANPVPLWNFTAADDPNVGYTYGTPFITKLANGTWVAVVTSGYNNVPEGPAGAVKFSGADGRGRVFVLDLATGAKIRTIDTNVGDTATPSGLARLNLRMRDFDRDNTAIVAYGGDLLGNMWRFNLDTGAFSKVAALGATKPITVAPEIAAVLQDTVALYFGSGRYLGKTDLDDNTVQSIYAIKDNGTTTVSGTSTLIQQTITDVGTTGRNISSNSVDWTTKNGWFVNLDAGERVTVDPQLYFGTLLFATTVPTATACQPGGYGWLYQLNYQTGGNVKQNVVAGKKYTSPIVGVTVSKLPNGTPVVYAITADGKRPTPDPLQTGDPAAGATKRVLWRELFD